MTLTRPRDSEASSQGSLRRFKVVVVDGAVQMAVVDEFLHDGAHLRLLHAIRGKRLGRLEHRAPRVACGTLALEEFEHEVLCFPPSRSLDGSEL